MSAYHSTKISGNSGTESNGTECFRKIHFDNLRCVVPVSPAASVGWLKNGRHVGRHISMQRLLFYRRGFAIVFATPACKRKRRNRITRKLGFAFAVELQPVQIQWGLQEAFFLWAWPLERKARMFPRHAEMAFKFVRKIWRYIAFKIVADSNSDWNKE